MPKSRSKETDEMATATIDETPTDTEPAPDVPTPEPVPDPIPPASEPSKAVALQDAMAADIDIIPSWREMQGLAAMSVTLAAAAAVPAPLRNKPNDVFLVLLSARDLGVALTTALREFHVIEGKVTLSPKVKLAMVREKNLGRIWPHQAPRDVDGIRRLCECGLEDAGNNNERATWHAVRHDDRHVLHSSTFTRADAETAGLLGKDNWKKYVARMLSWRALGYLLDDVYSEVGTGLYSPDELGAVTDEDGVPVIDVTHTEPLPGTSAPRGHHSAGAPAPPPGELPIDVETMQTLERRIAALAVLKDQNADGVTARDTLLGLWTVTGENNQPKLPPLKSLVVRQVKVAEALIASIEARAKKGEWGEWSPPADPATGEIPDDDDPDPVPPAAPIPPTAQAPAGEDEPVASDPAADPDDAETQRIIDTVAKMDHATVLGELTARGLETTSRQLSDHQRQLALAMWNEYAAEHGRPLVDVPETTPRSSDTDETAAADQTAPDTAPASLLDAYADATVPPAATKTRARPKR